MSVQIRIIPEEVRNISGTQQTIAETIGNSVEQLTSASSLLSGAWDSEAALQMIDFIEQVEKALKSLNSHVFEGSSRLVEIANLFENIDGNLDSPFSIAKMVSVNNVLMCPMFRGISWNTSSSGTIRIVPEDVRHVAELCDSVSTECHDISGQWNSTLEQLQAVWEGNAASKYYSTYSEVDSRLQDICDATDELANKLRLFADRYEEIGNMFS